MKALATGFVAGLLLVGCGFSQTFTHFLPSDKRVPVYGTTFEGRYKAVWNSAGHDAPDPHRELFQLGVPSSNMLVLWHKYGTSIDPSTNQVKLGTPTTIPTVLDSGVAVAANIKRVDADGNELIGQERPGRFAVERIEIHGLQADHPYTIKLNDREIPATTAPAPMNSPNEFSFVATSCNATYGATTDNGHFSAARINSLNLFSARARGLMAPNGWPKRPSFHIGLGDQVYVDPDNEAGRKSPISIFQGWDSVPVFDPVESYGLLRTVYDYHFAAPPFDEGLREIPSALIWDDHEVRDGWRSRGSDVEGSLTSYYQTATEAFWAYQGLRNPNPTWTSTPGARSTFDVEYDWGGRTHVLLPDGRSNRTPGIKLPGAANRPAQVFSKEQFGRIQSWLASVSRPTKEGHVFVLGLPSTISFGRDGMASICGDLSPEAEDDALDTWACNPKELSELLRILKAHFLDTNPQDLLLVLTGDVHMSSIQALVVDDKLLGYEVVTSGIANDVHKRGLKEALFKSGHMLAENVMAFGMGTIRDAPSFAELKLNLSNATPAAEVTFYVSGAPVKHGDDELINPVSSLRSGVGSTSILPVARHSTDEVRYDGIHMEGWNECSLRYGDHGQPLTTVTLAKRSGLELPTWLAKPEQRAHAKDPKVPLQQCSTIALPKARRAKNSAAQSWTDP